MRRSHGVAHSWSKHVARSDNPGKEMRRRGPGRTALRWTTDNALFEALGATSTPMMTMRYEDFVAAPKPSTQRMAEFLRIDSDCRGRHLPDRRARSQLATDHSVWGNPMRLRSGPEVLKVDEAWRKRHVLA